ncbi:MAG: hypothetical protein AAF449_17880, partial [Myxococcota bacterium]
MRRRKHKRSGLVFATALFSSVLVHALIGIPLRDWVNAYLSSGEAPAPPVRVVSVSRAQWAKNRQVNGRRPPSQVAPPPPPPPPAQPKPKPKPETKLKGQIVEVPPTKDDSPNPDAKYLSKYNSNVEKETVARLEERDRTKKRVTNKLQNKSRSSRRDAVRNPVLDV